MTLKCRIVRGNFRNLRLCYKLANNPRSQVLILAGRGLWEQKFRRILMPLLCWRSRFDEQTRGSVNGCSEDAFYV